MKINLLSPILMLAIACPILAQDDPSPTPDAASADSNVVIMLTRNRQLEGELPGLQTVSVKTSFGEATFPIANIEGIKLHADEKDSCIFAFRNGDMVTAQLALDQITLSTDWGDASINTASIETIKLNTKGEFFQDTSAGKTVWRYGLTREIRSQQNSTTPARAGTGTPQRNNSVIRRPGFGNR